MSRLVRGVVCMAVLDVRRRPDHRSELTSQLLLGEVVGIVGAGSRGGWELVEGMTDGYRGWVWGGGLVRTTRARAGSWAARASARAAAPVTEVRSRPAGGTLVSPLFLNSRVIPGIGRDGWRRVELPDGRRGWVDGQGLAARDARIALRDRILGLMGVPYHWGGRTPLGFDCSGFVQQVLAEQGVRLPRDATRQMRACRRLRDGESPRLGDLVFFRAPGQPVGHVGLGLGGGYYAHCRGMVKISSLVDGNPLYDNALADSVFGWRRPVGLQGPLSGPAGGGETA